MQFTQQFVTQHVSFWQHVMGKFLSTHIHFSTKPPALTTATSTTRPRVNINININDHYHHRLDDDKQQQQWQRQWQQQQQQQQLGLETHLCLEPQVCFSFFAIVQTYAQGLASHNTGDWLQAHMRRLRRVQVSFLLFFSTFFTLLMSISKQTMRTERERELR
jgi:hypothetical protein